MPFGNVSVINVSTGVVTANIQVAALPYAVAFAPDGHKAYVTGIYDMSVINVITGTVVSDFVFDVMSGHYSVAITPDGTKAYVTSTGYAHVSVINVSTGAVTSTIAVGNIPNGVAFSPDGTKAYVTNTGSNTISVINVSTGVVTATIGVDRPTSAVAFTPDGTRAYVASTGATTRDNGTVSVINVSTGTVTSIITVGRRPYSVAITPDGTKAYVVNTTDNTVSVINVITGIVTATIFVDTGPLSVAITPDGTKAYVVNFYSDTVSVINVGTGIVTAKIHVGRTPYYAGCGPYAVAFSPDGTKAYVTAYVYDGGYGVGGTGGGTGGGGGGGGTGGGGGGPTTTPTGDIKGNISAKDRSGVSQFNVLAQLYTGRNAATASPDGYYEIDAVPIGFYSVLFADCGFYPVLAPVTVIANTSSTLSGTLSPLSVADSQNGFLCGFAVNTLLGTAVAGASVQITSTGNVGGGLIAPVITDAGGGWISPSLVPGGYTLTVTAAGFTTFTSPNPLIVVPGCPSVVIGPGIFPTGGGSVWGYAEDAVSLAPLAATTTVVVQSPLFTAATDAKGRYEIDNLPSIAPVLTIAASHAGYRTRQCNFRVNSSAAVRLDIGLMPNGTPTGSLDGFVTDSATGLAIGNATISVPGIVSSVTAANGYFLLPDLPVGSVAVLAVADGYAAALAAFTVVVNVTTRISISLSAASSSAASIYGQVRDGLTGAALVGSVVSVSHIVPGTGLSSGTSTTSISRGAYLLANVPVPPFTHTVGSTFAGYYPATVANLPLSIGQSLELNLGMTSLSTPVGSLHGYTFDALFPKVWLPGTRVTVGAWYETYSSAPYGEYSLTYIPATAVFDASGTLLNYAPTVFSGVTVPLNAVQELDFPMVSFFDYVSYSVTVTVLRAGDLVPLAGASVDTGAFGVPIGITNASGQVTLTGLPSATVGIIASLAGYRVGMTTATLLPNGTNSVQILLSGFPDSYSGGQIYGHVTASVLPPGRAVPGTLVSASPSFGLPSPTGSDVFTGATGMYLIDNAPVTGGSPDTMTFDHPDYALLAISGVAVALRTSTRCDAVLSPYDGRIPAGWTVMFSALSPTSRPVGAMEVAPNELSSTTVTLRGTSQAYVTTKDTASLARYRRVRWNHRQAAQTNESQFRFAVAFAPGTKIHGVAATAIALPGT